MDVMVATAWRRVTAIAVVVTVVVVVKSEIVAMAVRSATVVIAAMAARSAMVEIDATVAIDAVDARNAMVEIGATVAIDAVVGNIAAAVVTAVVRPLRHRQKPKLLRLLRRSMTDCGSTGRANEPVIGSQSKGSRSRISTQRSGFFHALIFQPPAM